MLLKQNTHFIHSGYVIWEQKVSVTQVHILSNGRKRLTYANRMASEMTQNRKWWISILKITTNGEKSEYMYRDGGLKALCHSFRFAYQQKVLKTFPAPGYLCSENGIVWLWPMAFLGKFGNLDIYIYIYIYLYML